MDRILITEGDPCGIGPDLLEHSYSRVKSLSKDVFILLIRSQTKSPKKGWTSVEDPAAISRPGLYTWNTLALTPREEARLTVGKPSIESGKAAYSSLLAAIQLQKRFGGNLVTLPLSKEWVLRSGVKGFRGHTETLADSYDRKTYMLMAGRELNVLTLTTHVPLIKVPFYLKKIHVPSLIAAIRSAPLEKRKEIAFLGLNPHAGEGGQIGTEEKSILEPMISSFKKSGLNVVGPISADAAFTEQNRRRFSLFLSCYHDQGLIPFKMWEGKYGVNMTLGLDFLRVSPDHGTAFDIAGKGLADPESLLQCLDWASGKLPKINKIRRQK
ncbi:PdxA family dehydrogenase [Leptospira inadai]|uniref:4-hydroxythreonine-4-phosphate dehydrogenase n=1 Tax=Leptospira inadai serovar Lyme TaxID=293084 RepID=A0ABX4YK93_9LEPT|nr:4-hydroxythreonine-4-phosphate dehydrogenase PdxA [Leptospira inadai]PNV75584.1 4-hydroxythreonine-4-phosphate dehydrogenase [Leptospira inadai serovar Lyme]